MGAQIRSFCAIAATFAVLAPMILGAPIASAQEKKPAAARPADAGASRAATDPAKGRKEIVSGIKLYEQGKLSQSIAKFTGAMRIGGLSKTDTAKALYYRGLAHQKQKKSAEAISDLTSALYLKDGLSEAERTAATTARSNAYKAVGVSAPALVASRGGPALQTVAAASPDGVPTLAPKSGAKPIPATSPLAPPDGAPPAAAQPGTRTAAASGTSQTSSSWAPVTKQGAEPKPVPQPNNNSAGTSVITNAVNSAGNFFSNLFSGGGSSSSSSTSTASSATSSSSSNPATSPLSTSPSAPSSGASPISTASTPKPAQSSGWSSTTQSAGNAKPAPSSFTTSTKPTRTAAATQAAPRVAKPSGRYRVQVAAVRSKSEAEQLVALIRQKYASSIGPRVPKIDETVYGNMGTFYRVHVGPYAKPKDTKPFCAALSSGGYDCMVVKK